VQEHNNIYLRVGGPNRDRIQIQFRSGYSYGVVMLNTSVCSVPMFIKHREDWKMFPMKF
jgi:hypothetical protein